MAKRRATFQFRPFSRRQLKVLTWWVPGSPVMDCDGIIADGAIRAGKTVSMALSFALWAMATFSGQNFAMCGKTIGSFRRNVLIGLKLMLLTRGYRVHDSRSDNLLTVSRNGIDNYFYIFGGKDERSQDLIQGITLAGVFFDEVALMPESFVNQAVGRCSVDGSKFWFNCNPAGPKHWFKVEWIDKCKPKRLLYLHFTMEDNLSLSEEVKARYRRSFVGVFFKRYIQGLWVAAEGVCYPLFADNPDAFVIDDPPPIFQGAIGVDFGGSQSAHSFTLVGYTPRFREVVVLDEYYHNNITHGRLSPADLDEAFISFVRSAKQQCPRLTAVYCDSAEQTLIQGLTIAAAKAHLDIVIQNAHKGPINDRIAFYDTLMAQGRFRIMRSCKHTIDALSEAVYDEKKPTEDVRLDNGKMNIDSLDSMEYATEAMQSAIMYLNLRG